MDAFQFPSNGKAYPKRYGRIVQTPTVVVSIPFKREGISKVEVAHLLTCACGVFVSIPFKREGISKARSPPQPSEKYRKVSIPFKREGISKEYYRIRSDKEYSAFGFNSLQTGRHIQRKEEMQITESDDVFQFPSNGKAYPKRKPADEKGNDDGDVSIPFKREGISKGYEDRAGQGNETCFSSLQTGRHIQSKPETRYNIFKTQCFNSLQTGRHIQSKQKASQADTS